MGAPKIPRLPPAPPPPALPIDTAILDARERARRNKRTGAGRQSTILTGPTGATGQARVATPMLSPPVALGK